MATRPDFTRKPVPPAASPAVDISKLGGGQPLSPGKVHLTPDTRAQLEKLGWKEGDPIPGNLGAKVKEVQARVQKEVAAARPELPPNFQPPKPKLINIDELPPAEQQELRNFMAEARKMGEAQAAVAAQQQQIEAQIPPGGNPAVAQAIRASAQAAMANAAPPAGPTASLDLPPGLAKALNPSPPVAAPPPPPAPPVAPPAAAPAAPATSETGVTGTPPPLCPRCKLNLQQPYEVVPTDHDRRAFVASILAQDRFYKEVSLLDGRLRITFRSLTSKEAELLYSQLRIDMQQGEILTDGEYYMKLHTYRLVMGLAKVVAQDKILAEMPSALEVPFQAPTEGPPQTVLVPLTRWLWEEVLPQELVRRMVGQQHREFVDLIAALEAQALEPDFWKGIGSQA